MNNAYSIENGRLGFRNARNPLVREMVENGQGVSDSGGIVWVDPLDMYSLLTDGAGDFDHAALRHLELPRQFDGDIELTVPAGRLAAPDFEIVIHYYESGAARTPRNRIPFSQEACILYPKDEEGARTMQPVLFTLIQKIRQFHFEQQGKQTYSANLRLWAEIRPLAEQLGAHLDSVLENERTELPDVMQVDISRNDDDTYRLVPRVFEEVADSESETDSKHAHAEKLNEGFEEAFRDSQLPKDVYTIRDGNNHSRIPVPSKSRPAIDFIRSRQRLSREEALQIVQNPAAAFDGIDVEFDPLLYSDRVKGIGLFSPKAIPFISKYKSDWIPGIFLDEMDDGRTQIPIGSTADLEELDCAVADAEANNSRNVSFRGKEFSIEDARECARVAKEQLSDQSTPHPEAGAQTGRKVLLIKENIFEDEFGALDGIENVTSSFVPVKTFNSEYQLKEYQQTGIGWLQYLYDHGGSGAVLADDMGLGKTLQVLYFLEWVAGTGREEGQGQMISLLVVPASVIENWEEEHKRFFPESRIIVLRLGNGGSTNAQDLLEAYPEYQAPVVVLTSYETVRSNQILLGKILWTVVVADEAQRIKNPGSQITNAMKAQQFQFALAITGTPVENSFFDLWCIFDFIAAGLLGTASAFGDEFGIKRNAFVEDPADVGQRIRARIGGHLLRRRKQDVLSELPPKYDSIHHADLHPFKDLSLAREMPAVQLDQYRMRIQESSAPVLSANRSNEALRRLQAIRQVSDHPFLDQEELLDYPSEKLIAASARMIATVEALEHIRGKEERAIIFAEFKRTQHLLQKVLFDRFGVQASIINGDTPVIAYRGQASRQQAISRFNESTGFNVIIMSPIAAGVGLNVTGANHVIHYSRHWNPARENQATDRAYRIGQEKPVFVYYPQAISSQGNTFDVVINELLQQKTSLASATLYPTEAIEVNPTDLLGRLSMDA